MVRVKGLPHARRKKTRSAQHLTIVGPPLEQGDAHSSFPSWMGAVTGLDHSHGLQARTRTGLGDLYSVPDLVSGG
jgi:hypothetical protein